jgi:hypothetical protein
VGCKRQMPYHDGISYRLNLRFVCNEREGLISRKAKLSTNEPISVAIPQAPNLKSAISDSAIVAYLCKFRRWSIHDVRTAIDRDYMQIIALVGTG